LVSFQILLPAEFSKGYAELTIDATADGNGVAAGRVTPEMLYTLAAQFVTVAETMVERGARF
jgi:hypothetical protein